MVELAEREGRVVLTCDQGFIARRLTDQAYWVRGANKKAQLAEVLRVFNLQIDTASLLSRCAKCNGAFIPRRVLLHMCLEIGQYNRHTGSCSNPVVTGCQGILAD